MTPPPGEAATMSAPVDVHAPADVSVRPFPYPYRAALAICSDLDETPAAQDYFDLAAFLNTTDATRLGRGIGLEVGNTIYFDMPPDQFSYWNGDEAARARLRALIASGHVDCLHSFGDLATTRAHAGRALDELARHGCELKVWIDHAVAPSNFGADIMAGQGDVVSSPVYHADLTCAFGIDYVWRGRVTSVIGQDAPRRLAGIASVKHPAASAVTVAKEAAKGVLGRLGAPKYECHPRNAVVWESSLRSGQPVYEFLRSNPSWGGISVHETAAGFGEVMTPEFLNRLTARGGASILYTHFGKTPVRGQLAPSMRPSLEALARASGDGELLVTTTRRLLDWCVARRGVSWTVERDAAGLVIDVSTAAIRRRGPVALDGLSFYVGDTGRASVLVDGVPAPGVRHNPADATGRPSVSLPWPRLSFPHL
jgi:hypothetical protein